MSPRARDGVAVAWGLAEALLFFVIPDVLLTWVAVRLGTAQAWRPAVWATLGAVVGGLVMYTWAAASPGTAYGALELVPAVDAVMIDGVRADVAAHGSEALFGGPWQGRPYKLYAAASGDLGLNPIWLAVLTVPGRLVRFAAAIAIAGCARRIFSRWLADRALVAGWAAFWALVYAGYWLA